MTVKTPDCDLIPQFTEIAGMTAQQMLEHEEILINAFGQIPVIVYSTSSNPSDIEETKALGAQRFITKPNSYDELCRVLGSTVNGVY